MRKLLYEKSCLLCTLYSYYRKVICERTESFSENRQLAAIVDLLVKRGLRPVIIGDRWYACAPFLARMSEVPASCLLRVKSNRVFFVALQSERQASAGRVAKMAPASNAHGMRNESEGAENRGVRGLRREQRPGRERTARGMID